MTSRSAGDLLRLRVTQRDLRLGLEKNPLIKCARRLGEQNEGCTLSSTAELDSVRSLHLVVGGSCLEQELPGAVGPWRG